MALLVLSIKMVQDLDTAKSKEVLSRFAGVTLVPQTRSYTAITQYDGSSAGETAGGFVKDAANGLESTLWLSTSPP